MIFFILFIYSLIIVFFITIMNRRKRSGCFGVLVLEWNFHYVLFLFFFYWEYIVIYWFQNYYNYYYYYICCIETNTQQQPVCFSVLAFPQDWDCSPELPWTRVSWSQYFKKAQERWSATGLYSIAGGAWAPGTVNPWTVRLKSTNYIFC